jgi:Outer membrane receptor for monomeric catechols
MRFSKNRYQLLLRLCALGMILMAAPAALAAGESTESLELDRVLVEAPRVGSAETGYKAESTKNLGLWGERKVLDTPYSMFIVSSDLIENVQARNTEQLFKMNPLVTAYTHDMNGISQISTRGFVTAHSYVNGIANDMLSFGLFVEEMEALEVLSGLSGFLYGSGNVAVYLTIISKDPPRTI